MYVVCHMKNIGWIFQLRPQDKATIQKKLWKYETTFSFFNFLENSKHWQVDWIVSVTWLQYRTSPASSLTNFILETSRHHSTSSLDTYLLTCRTLWCLTLPQYHYPSENFNLISLISSSTQPVLIVSGGLISFFKDNMFELGFKIHESYLVDMSPQFFFNL